MNTARTKALVRRKRRDDWLRRALDSYAGRAFLSPFHLVASGIVAGATVVSHSLGVLLVGAAAAEALIVGALPRTRLFRGMIESKKAAAESAAKAERSAAAFARLNEMHKARVIQLKLFASAIADRSFDDARAANELVDAYVAIAVAVDEASRALGRSAHETEGGSARVRELVRRRRALRAKNELRVRALLESLSVLEETVKLLYEGAVVALDAAQVIARTNELVEHATRDLDAWHELAAGIADSEP